MSISIIFAQDHNGNIGKENELPWRFIKSDMAWFVECTKNKTVIMGRKTYESIGKLLPNRKNVILTRDMDYKVEGAIIVNSVAEALVVASETESETMVIGGKEIYDLFIPYAVCFYVTDIDVDVLGCDTVAPTIPNYFIKAEVRRTEADEQSPHACIFSIYSNTYCPN